MGSSPTTLRVDLNRVEGDLEVKLAMDGNRVSEARVGGRMYRGFEQILIGRHARDGLVITPRICGICGTAHLYAAVTALETAGQCQIAPNGTRVRNLCLMAEEVQSDARHTFLMFAVDLCNEKYRHQPLFPQINTAFQVFSGKFYRETIQKTKKLLEIVALFGGQWPHSSYMIPGGVTTVANRKEMIRSLTILDDYINWYENSILGCTTGRWLALRSQEDLSAWLEEHPAHHQSAVGLFLRFGREIGLHRLGCGHNRLLSYGAYFDPDLWQPPFTDRHCLRAPGFFNPLTGQIESFCDTRIEEHVEYSWFVQSEDKNHPFGNKSIPDYDPKSKRYSWAKAPRYDNQVVEVGALAELVVAGDPLLTSLFQHEGSSVWLRELARLHRPVLTLTAMRATLLTLLTTEYSNPFYISPGPIENGTGKGLIQAARGGLGHWLTLGDGKISAYQIISPTTWNASPRDSLDRPGHWEATLAGTEITDMENPLEIEHIIRSHDACLVCCVHFLDTGKKIRFGLEPRNRP